MTDGTYDEVVYCDDCGYEISRTPRTVTALTKSFTSYVSDNNATCTTDCTETAVCDREGCDETDTRDIADTKLGYAWSSEWTSNETHHWHECENGSRCPNTANDSKNGYEEHSRDWTITTYPTKRSNGVKERTCPVCGLRQTEKIKYIPDSTKPSTGELGVLNLPTNVDNGKVEVSAKEIVNSVTLTNEERDKIENGINVNVALKVTAGVSSDDETMINSATPDGFTVDKYLDIKLWKVIGDDFSTTNKTQVNTTNAPIKIVITLPEALIEPTGDLERTYKIIRVHGTETKIIDTVFDKVTKQLSFMSD